MRLVATVIAVFFATVSLQAFGQEPPPGYVPCCFPAGGTGSAPPTGSAPSTGSSSPGEAFVPSTPDNSGKQSDDQPNDNAEGKGNLALTKEQEQTLALAAAMFGPEGSARKQFTEALGDSTVSAEVAQKREVEQTAKEYAAYGTRDPNVAALVAQLQYAVFGMVGESRSSQKAKLEAVLTDASPEDAAKAAAIVADWAAKTHDQLDALGDLTMEKQLRLQSFMQPYTQTMAMISRLMSASAETQNNIIANMR